MWNTALTGVLTRMNKIDSLTGLRLFAALAVFLSHTQPPTTMPETVRTMMLAGYSGVTLFFVLSGFVLTWTYVERMPSPGRTALRDFAVARVARVAPLYFVALAFAFVAGRGALPEHSWTHLFALQTWNSNYETAFAINPPGWSIGVETFLYALFPLLLWMVLRATRRGVVAVLLGSVLLLGAITLAVYVTGGHELPVQDPLSDNRLLYRTPLTRVPDFVIGMCVALLVFRSKGRSRLAPLTQWAAVAAIVMMMGSSRMLDSIVSWDLVYAVLAGALVWSLASAPDALLAKVLAHPLLVRGGLVSFAFYLFHYPILELADVNFGDGLVWAMGATTALTLSVLVAIGAHMAIEVPAQRWLRHRLSSKGQHDLPLILDVDPVVVREPQA